MARRFVFGMLLAMLTLALTAVSASADGWPPLP
jgi:hypothetical protein